MGKSPFYQGQVFSILKGPYKNHRVLNDLPCILFKIDIPLYRQVRLERASEHCWIFRLLTILGSSQKTTHKGLVKKYRGGGGWAGAERGWVMRF